MVGPGTKAHARLAATEATRMSGESIAGSARHMAPHGNRRTGTGDGIAPLPQRDENDPPRDRKDVDAMRQAGGRSGLRPR
jgi:hypothetical protein